MKQSSRWRSRLTGSMLGQLQLATYAAVLLGFTGATTTGLWLSERNQKRLGEAELLAAANALTRSWSSEDQDDVATMQAMLKHHSSRRTHLWLEQSSGMLITPPQGDTPIPVELLPAAMAANPQRRSGQVDVITVNGREYLTLLTRHVTDGPWLWSSTEITSVGTAQSEYLAWMIVIWGGSLGASLLLVSVLVKRITRPLQELSARSAELTADALNHAGLPVPKGPAELTQLTLTYNALTQRLAQSWSQQRQFVSAVSHELQTPLTLVSGSIRRVIRKAPNLEPPLAQRLRDAEDETRGMQQLLNDLLDLSRSDSGRLQVKQEPVALRPLLDTVVRVQAQTLDRTIQLELPTHNNDASEPSERALGDEARLHQVLLNLIQNAHKYSPPELPIQLRLLKHHHAVILEVEDLGIGIPHADQAQIFDRFHRGSNTAGQTGSGIGLSVVQLLVNAMGGSISVTSEPGMGSCFRIQLQEAP